MSTSDMDTQPPSVAALSEAQPPSYQEYDQYPRLAGPKDAAIDAGWDKSRPENWETIPWGNMVLDFHQGPTVNNDGRQWWAKMRVHVRCVPRLMRNGFHWSSANVITEKSFVALDGTDPTLSSCDREAGFLHTRTFFLEDDRSMNGEKEWTARLRIVTRNQADLAAFRLEQLTPDTILECAVENWDRKCVYQHVKGSLQHSFNAVYDDLPLKGWWPWPKGDRTYFISGRWIGEAESDFLPKGSRLYGT